jgi:hypothetical protein
MRTSKTIVATLTALAVLGLASTVHAADTDKLKADAQAAWDKTKDTARDLVDNGKDLAHKGAEKATEVGTNVLAKVKEGAHKAGDAVSNAASKVNDKVHSMTK